MARGFVVASCGAPAGREPGLDRNVSLAIVVLSGAAMGVYGYLPAFWSLPTTFLSEAAAAACIGLINSFGNLGGFVGNYAIVWPAPLSSRPC